MSITIVLTHPQNIVFLVSGYSSPLFTPSFLSFIMTQQFSSCISIFSGHFISVSLLPSANIPFATFHRTVNPFTGIPVAVLVFNVFFTFRMTFLDFEITSVFSIFKLELVLTCDVAVTFAYVSHTTQGRACAIASLSHGRAHRYSTPRRPSTLYCTRKPQAFDADTRRVRAEGLLLDGRMREDEVELCEMGGWEFSGDQGDTDRDKVVRDA